TMPLYNIGEHAYNLSSEYKEKYNDISWGMIAGLRHRLVHDYDGTNWNIIAEAVFEELPKLANQLKIILKGLN
ncbi:MAG: DUF86 domain-containing protein, partial [Oscillospiraceae bacterium]|nr:DUF86 domain-containing protein [Oscillospiraceae bacterium]